MSKTDKKAAAASKLNQAASAAPEAKDAPTPQSEPASTPEINLPVAIVAIERGLNHYRAFKDAHEALSALQNLEQVKAERERAANAAFAKADEARAEHAAEVARGIEAREANKQEAKNHKTAMRQRQADTEAACGVRETEAQERVDALAKQQAALTADLLELDVQIIAKTAEVQALENRLEAAKDAARKAAASVLGD